MEAVVTRVFLGDLALIDGNLEEAQALYVESVSALREIQDQSFLAGTLRRLGHVACRHGEIGEATLMYTESLSINRELRDDRGIIACLSALAGAVSAHGKATVASQIFGGVEALLRDRNIHLRQIDQLEFDRNTSSLRVQIDPETLERSWAKGAAMTLEEVMTLALREE
jgi:hypothetical protein